MKKVILFGMLAVISLFGLQSFGSIGDSNPTIQVDSVCFSRDVLPILNSNCAMSFCHDAISHKGNYILTSYSGISKGVKAGNSTNSSIYKQILNDKMPESPFAKLTATQKTVIKNWIDQGAKNSTCEVTDCDTTNVTFSTIKPIITNNCLGCHNAENASAKIDLSTDKQIDELKEIILCTILHASYCKPMPYNGLSLSNCEQKMIKRWVTLSSTGNIQQGEQIANNFNIRSSNGSESATINFQLDKRQIVAMSLYSYQGRKIRDISKEEYSEGSYELTFPTNNLSVGVYFVRIQAGTSIQSLMFTH